MRILTAALIACALLTGCATESTPSRPTGSFPRAGDGTTPETAVRIRTYSDTELNRTMKRWLKTNYPEYKVLDQEVTEERGGFVYNVVSIAGPGQSTKRIFFDITMFAKRVNDPNSSRLPGSTATRP
jgi:hypothetical protein